ncbi:hypothetical protein [Achromobacter sp. UMC71]|uniref:hypothetical protein n=1 Tax=Achromobacter sp. UMC71 TaxID=1862320 RepID=UPI0015FFEED1|nr:hypothetical protein [Achromobacter sp. UMC71]MBB1626467.1 hypothetical protein [Achromobacter sp. UMC71]
MPIARTYYFNDMRDGELAALLGKREDFFLENVDNLNDVTQRIQSLLAQAGLSSRVEITPLNGPATFADIGFPMVPIIGWLWAMVCGASRLVQPRGDVTLRATSNTSITVAFSPSTRQPAA